MESNFLQKTRIVSRWYVTNRNRARPLIARFTCPADRDRAWKACYRLKNSRISMGEDLPQHTQEIRKNVLIPAMKKIKQERPSHKATVVGYKLVVNGKSLFSLWRAEEMASCQLSEYPGGLLWQWYSRTTRTIAKSRRILWCYGPIPRTA